MKHYSLLLLAFMAILLSSCKTQQDVLYLQDVTEEGTLANVSTHYLTFQPGDKFTVTISSEATPELVARYNQPIMSVQAGSGSAISSQTAPYIVDQNGQIEMSGIGKVTVGGLTRLEAAALIQQKMRNGFINDALINITPMDRYFTILGEVKNPGRFNITRESMTLLEALGAAGDLNITGKRNEIVLIREEGGKQIDYLVDLRSKDFMNSPAYFLKQNDVIYVKPNKMRSGQARINDNSARSISTWLSVSSVLISLGILIFR